MGLANSDQRCRNLALRAYLPQLIIVEDQFLPEHGRGVLGRSKFAFLLHATSLPGGLVGCVGEATTQS